MAAAGAVIDPADPRVKDEAVAFLLDGMKCRLQITSGTARSSILETGEKAATKIVTAALVVTDDKLILDLKREGEDKPKEYLNISYRDPLFQELGLEYGNSKKTGHLICLLPDAKRFMKSSDLGLNDNTTIKVTLDTYKAPDVAMHVQRILHKNMGDNCTITDDDARLAGQEVLFLLNSVKCRLQIQPSSAGPGTGPRSSILGTVDTPAEKSVFAALAVTKEKLVLDLKRAGVEDPPVEYLCVSFQDELCKEVGLEYSNDVITSHLVIVLPNAKHFFRQSPGDLDVPENTTVKLFIDTWKAPDIVVHVRHQMKSGVPCKTESCIIAPEDPRVAGNKIDFLFNSMKCRLQVSAGGDKKIRSSILGTVERPAMDKVIAALAITDQKCVLDIKRIGTDDPPVQYLCVGYGDDLCQNLTVEYSNDASDSHLVIVLRNAGKFFVDKQGIFDVPDDSTVRVYMDTWKAPDIAMFVRSHIRKASKNWGKMAAAF